VISISETHLPSTVDNNTLAISGYVLFRGDRVSGLHGGVAIYIKANIPSVMLGNSCDPNGEWETIWCQIQLNNSHHLHIGCCYRIPSNALPDHWPGFLSALNHYTLNDPNISIIFFGDFNLPNYQLGGCAYLTIQ